MARFNTTVGSESAAIGLLGDVLDILDGRKYTATSTAGAQTATASATNFVNGVWNLGSGSTFAMTTLTAAQIIAALPNCEVGSAFVLRIYNANSGTATLTAGSGVTFVGPSTVTTAKCQAWDFIVTNMTAGSEAVVAVAHTYANV